MLPSTSRPDRVDPDYSEPPKSSPFFRLPIELRYKIYELVLRVQPRVATLDWESVNRKLGPQSDFVYGQGCRELSLLRVNRQFYNETIEICRRLNCFVHLIDETSRPIAWELNRLGALPLYAEYSEAAAKSAAFPHYSMRIRVHENGRRRKRILYPYVGRHPPPDEMVLLAERHLPYLGLVLAQRAEPDCNENFLDDPHIDVEVLEAETCSHHLFSRQDSLGRLLSPIRDFWWGFPNCTVTGAISAEKEQDVNRSVQALCRQSAEETLETLSTHIQSAHDSLQQGNAMQALETGRGIHCVVEMRRLQTSGWLHLCQPPIYRKVVQLEFDTSHLRLQACSRLLKEAFQEEDITQLEYSMGLLDVMAEQESELISMHEDSEGFPASELHEFPSITAYRQAVANRFCAQLSYELGDTIIAQRSFLKSLGFHYSERSRVPASVQGNAKFSKEFTKLNELWIMLKHCCSDRGVKCMSMS